MPYFIARSGKRFCVKQGTPAKPGKMMKCYPDKDAAVKYLRALMKNVPDAKKMSVGDSVTGLFIPAADGTALPMTTGFFTTSGNWPTTEQTTEQFTLTTSTNPPVATKRGSRIRLYFAEADLSPDGRYLDPFSTNFNRQPPYPFRLQTKSPESGGHAGAELAGVLTTYFRDGTTLILEGPLDMASPAGRETERLMREGFLQTWSPDLGDVTWDDEVLEVGPDGFPTRVISHVVSSTFLGGTAVAIPALGSAVMELLDDEGNVIVPALVRGIRASAEVPAFTVHENTDAQETAQTVITRLRTLAACARDDAPPAEFFTNPNLTELQRFTTITDDGRVFGHAAGFGECHIGYRNACYTITDIADCRGDGNFEYAMPGYVVTSDGQHINTGPIPIKGGHAPRDFGWEQALSYYADVEAVVADVVYGMDEFGVWFSGALRPTATADMVYVLRASGVSLDSREINGELRYLLTVCVNSGGYPKLGIRLAASGEDDSNPRILALVAAGGAPEPAPDCGCDDEFADLQLRVLQTRVKAVS